MQVTNARDVLPPPLNREGERVQPSWLYRFLLNPKTVRPQVILNMPRFNMSHEEANALVDYFIAVDKLTNPASGTGTAHLTIPQGEEAFWHGKTHGYVAELKDKKKDAERLKALDPYWKLVLEEQAQDAKRRLDIADAALKQSPMDENAKKAAEDAKKESEAIDKRLKNGDFGRLIDQYQDRDAYAVDGYRLLIGVKFCVSCHQVNGVGEKKGPALDLTEGRLRPEWTLRWIANPPAMFPYNPIMPLNVPRKQPGAEDFQDLFAGSSRIR